MHYVFKEVDTHDWWAMTTMKETQWARETIQFKPMSSVRKPGKENDQICSKNITQSHKCRQKVRCDLYLIGLYYLILSLQSEHLKWNEIKLITDKHKSDLGAKHASICCVLISISLQTEDWRKEVTQSTSVKFKFSVFSYCFRHSEMINSR